MRSIAVAVLALIAPGSALASDWSGFYAEIYGGARLAGVSTYYDDHLEYDMLAGPVVGASVGVGTPVPGLSAELDLMWTSAEYDYLDEYLRTLSLMANLEYTVALNDTFAVYGLVGAGLLNITFEDSVGETWSGTGPGYQLGAGVRAQLTDQVALYAEYKFQNSFGYVDVEGDDVSSPTSNVLLGLRFTP